MQTIVKNKLLYILIVPLLLLLAGCGGGGNDKSDGGGTQPNEINVSYAGDVNISGNRLTMHLNFTEEPGKSPASGKVRMHDFHFALSGSGACRMEKVSYTPREIDTYPSVLTVRGVFGPSGCHPENYTLQYKETITIDGHSKTTLKSVGGKLYPHGGPYTISATPTELAVSEGGQSGELTVQVLSDGQPASDVNVSGSLDLLYGKLDKYEATTDSSGIIVFQYTAPDDIRALVGKHASISLHLTQLPSVATSVGLFFGKQPPIDTTHLRLYASPKTINISKAGDKRSIDLYLVNEATHQPVEGVLLKAYSFDPNLGTLNHYEATTDVNGKATFDYTAPAPDLPKKSFTLTFDVVNASKPIPENVVVNLQPIDTSRFRIYTVPDVVNITKEGEKHPLKIYIENTLDRSPVEGIVIKALMFDPKLGTLDHYEATTDANGKASFEYTAPDTLPATAPVPITFALAGGSVVKEANVTLNFVKNDYDNYTLRVLPPQIMITQAAEIEPIQIYVADSHGRPAVNAGVEVQYFDQKYGSMDHYSVITDENGHAEVQFIAPSSIDTLDGTEMHFDISLAGSSGRKKSVTVLYRKAAENVAANIYVMPSQITVLRGKEPHRIKLTAVDSNNYGVVADLKIENPTLDGKDYGTFDKLNIQTDPNGNAYVTYTSPEDIRGLAERNISITDLKSHITKILTLDFKQPNEKKHFYDFNLSVNQSLQVDSNGLLGVAIRDVESGKLIEDKNVIEVNLTIEQGNMLRFDKGMTKQSYSQSSTKNFRIFAQKISGVVVVEARATVFDGEEKTTIAQEYPIVIMSGPLSSMSMFHAVTTLDTATGLYKDVYTVHAVDKYGNPVQKGTKLHPSLINGVKLHGKGSGKIIPGSPSLFRGGDFSNVNNEKDRLIILPSEGKTGKLYLGDWTIQSHSKTQLSLAEKYSGEETDGLDFVIGNENRIIDGQIAVADISSPDGKYETDEQGNMQFVVTYDPLLKGKDFYVATNGDSSGQRIGVSLSSEFYYGGYTISVEKQDLYVYQNLSSSYSQSDKFIVFDNLMQETRENLSLKNVDPGKGTLNVYYYLDAPGGYIQYTAPEDITDLLGSTYTFKAVLRNAPTIEREITVHFARQPIDYSKYRLLPDTKQFDVTQDEQTRWLTFSLRNGDKVVEDQRVTLDLIDPMKGSFDHYSAVTDYNGEVHFLYIAPADISTLRDQNLTIHAYLESNSSVDANVTAVFKPEGYHDYTGYKVTAVPQDINITIPEEVKTIDVWVEDNATLPAAGETLNVVNFDRSKGQMDRFSAVTDANGHATFHYIAPKNIDGLETNFTIALAKAPTVSPQTIHVQEGNKNPPVDTTGMKLYVVPSEMNVSTPGESRTVSIYLENVKDESPVEGITIKANFFDPNLGTLNSYEAVTDANGRALFHYVAPEEIVSRQFDITFDVKNAAVSLARKVRVNLMKNPPVDTTGMKLDATPDPVKIDYANQSALINLYLSKGDAVVPDTKIIAHFFDPSTGTLSSYEATTDSSGKASFLYFAPDALPKGDIAITFEVANGSPTLERNVTVQFTPSAPVDTTGMKLDATPDPVKIDYANQSALINLYLSKGDAVVPDTKIIAHFFDPSTGTLSSYEATTDSSGKASFLYFAPDALPKGDIAITFEVANGSPTLERNVTVQFTPSAPVDTTGMKLTVVPTELNVSTAGESRTISVYVDRNTSDGVEPAEGITVKADFFDPNYGTLSSYSATTNANGQAVFEYTAPDPFVNGDVNISFDIANATESRERNVSVHLNDSTPPIDTSSMKLYTLPNEVNISVVGETRTINIYVERNTTDGVEPADGVAVKADFFDPNYGTLNTYSMETDANGRAAFKYTAPDRMPVEDLNITFAIVHGNPPLAKLVAVHFDRARYFLEADRNLTVSQTNKKYVIHAALYRQKSDGTKEPAVGKTVVAEFLMPIFGTISSYESVVDSNGIATFQYTSPSRFVDLNDTNVTFYYKDRPVVSGKTTLLFRPENVDEVEHLYVIPSHITITEPGQEKNITIVTVNGANMGIPTTVDVEQPSNETDYGYFTPSGPVTTDASGRATLVYTAPDAIDRLSERNITFQVHDKKALSRELVIDYDQGSGPGTRYEITVSSPNSLAVDSLDQITVIIHEYGNVDNVIADEDVHEVNLSSKFVNMLVFENNASTYSYGDYGTKAIDVQTKRLSGTAVIDINASIFNGDHDVLIQGSYPVVILSGPVTSLSLFYASTSEDTDLGIYKNIYTIHAVDKYDNPARAGITLHPSIINGTKVIKAGSTSGKIVQGSPATFRDDSTSNVFDSVDVDDLLAIVPNANRFGMEYVGNWSLDDVISSNELELVEDYYGETTDGLSYVIGNSQRYLLGYGVANVDIKDRDGKGFVTDENGNVQFEVTFDPVLAGHTVTITATAYDGNRTGIAKVAALRWNKYSSTSKKIPNDGNDHNVTLSLGISGGVENLIDLDIVPSSIKTSSGQCKVTNTPLDPNLHTDANGQILVTVHTEGSDPDVKECTVQWSATQSGIYMEY